VSRGGGLQRREAWSLLGLGALLAATFAMAVAFGSTTIPLRDVVRVLLQLEPERTAAAIVVETVRLPRALTAALAGAALGVAGLQMQTLFRNPLADPFALGVSSGASLGVAFVVLGAGHGAAALFGSGLGLGGDAVIVLAAIAGATLVLAVVLAVASRIESSPTVLVLGLMIGYATSAVVTVLVGATEPERLQVWAAWQFGSFAGVTGRRLTLFLGVVGAGLGTAWLTTKPLNAFLLGEAYARSMGVAVRRARLVTMVGASALGAVVTAFCGPVSFLGIAVPHLCRGLLGTSDHRPLVPAVALLGAAVALVAQTVSVLPGGGAILPLNAVTALLGAPVVVAVLLRSRREGVAP
jgi:iron complex transport system permease protein